MKAQIAGIEYHLPDATLDNEQLAKLFPQWTAEAIEKKTGIRLRHLAATGETSSDLAVAAAQKLFASGKASPGEFDFLIFCTQTPDYLLPGSACLIQDRLHVPTSAGAVDISMGCSGFVYGLAQAKGLIETGQARTVLLLTGETYTKILHPADQGVRPIFGDGAAATVLRGVESESDLVGPFVFGTDGSGWEALALKAGGMRLPRAAAGEAVSPGAGSPEYLHMDGPAVFSFTLKAAPLVVDGLLRKSGLTMDDIDLFVFHQANKFMLDSLRKQIKIPPERFFVSMEDKGNTVSSTIPIALADAQKAGVLRAGARIMLVGFGVGLSWGGTLVSLPDRI